MTKEVERTDCSACQLQQFWLDVVAHLVMFLERDEKFHLPAEAIQMA